MAKEQNVPLSIRRNRVGWLLKDVWHLPHSYGKMASIVFCAEPGSGKSWLCDSFAEILDRDSVNDVCRFGIDKVAFSAEEFTALVAKDDWPVGTCLVFDDAALHAFSRESMQRQVRLLSKTFQMMRYKRLIVLLSLPALSMLDKNIRMLTTAYCQPLMIDYDSQRTLAKFQWTNFNPKTGDVYYKRPTVNLKSTLPFGYAAYSHKALSAVWFDRPSEELAVAYEKKKRVQMDDWARRSALKVAAVNVERKESAIEHWLAVIKKDEHSCTDDAGVVRPALIVQNHPGIAATAARLVAGALNAQNGFVLKGGGVFERRTVPIRAGSNE